jgi:beta-glucosidase
VRAARVARRTARACAIEATANLGLDATYAPMVDIARDQRWGRVVEGAGEDVLLGSLFAAARVRGFQGDQRGGADSLLACPKHFAAYGAAESGLTMPVQYFRTGAERGCLPPPLPPSSRRHFSRWPRSTPSMACQHQRPPLLTEILRGEPAFQARCPVFKGTMQRSFAADEREAAFWRHAGCDIGMVSGIFPRYVPELVRTGVLDEEVLDQAVRRILFVKREAGLFDDPFRRVDEQRSKAGPPKSHRELAREAAQKSVVLLKNEGDLLPLPKTGKRIALIGPFGEDGENLDGPWSPFVPAAPSVSLAEGLRNAMADPDFLRVVKGSEIDAPINGRIDEAVAAARAADVVILAIGEATSMSGESASRTEIVVPQAQQALAEAVAATGKPIVVVLRNGRALALEGAVRDARATLVGWFLGTETGGALATCSATYRVGRLTDELPVVASSPTTTLGSSGTPPEPGSTAPFAARFMGIQNEPLYLRTRDGLRGVEYGPTRCCGDGPRRQRRSSAEVPIAAAGGRRSGAAVRPRPDRRCGAARARAAGLPENQLGAGVAGTVTFRLAAAAWAFGPGAQRQIEPGDFDVWITVGAGREPARLLL